MATSYALAHPFTFDIAGPAFKSDPYPTWAAMRAAGPVIPIRLPFVGRVWATTTHAATLALVKDNETFVQEGAKAGKSGVAGMQWWMRPRRAEGDHQQHAAERRAGSPAGCASWSTAPSPAATSTPCVAPSRPSPTACSTAWRAARPWTSPSNIRAACRWR